MWMRKRFLVVVISIALMLLIIIIAAFKHEKVISKQAHIGDVVILYVVVAFSGALTAGVISRWKYENLIGMLLGDNKHSSVN